MRDYSINYQSEFEREFDTETLDSEFEDTEFELENDSEYSEEMEFEDESDSESDYLNEFESDNEFEENEYEDNSYEFDYGSSREREFENRLYRALTANHDNEFEADQAINRVFYELEQDFFFNKLKKYGKNFLKTKGGQLLKKVAKNSPWGIAVEGLTKMARGDIKGALKGVLNNDLIKQAISFAPGGATITKGMDIANKLMQNEASDVSKAKAKAEKTVQLANGSYKHLAKNLANMSDPRQLQTMGKDAVKKAMADMDAHRKGMQKTKIPLKAGSIVSVHGTYVNIWQPK